VLKHPAYSQKLLLLKIHMFGSLNKALKGFMSGDMWENEVQWLRQQPKEFFADDICQPEHQWDSCVHATHW
jgi:hypothetical protein